MDEKNNSKEEEKEDESEEDESEGGESEEENKYPPGLGPGWWDDLKDWQFNLLYYLSLTIIILFIILPTILSFILARK